MLLTNHSKNKNCLRFSLRAALLFIVLAGVLAVFNTPVFSQSNVTGGFEGRVTDGVNGPGLSGVTVQFVNVANGYQSAKKTDSTGYFQQTFLSPGVYKVRVEAPGYKVYENQQILYATKTNELRPLPIPLEKESTVAVTNPTPTPTGTPTVTQTPTPTDTGQTGIETPTGEYLNQNPRRDGIFGSREVMTLPLGGTTLTRTFDELAFLVPGVYLPPQAIGNSVGPGVGGGVGTSGQFSVNGLRSRANNFTVDGSDNNDEDIGVRRQGFFTLVPQPIESIQEFQIITLLAPAQYGRNLGAQVNAVSKSGGNQFRGTIYGMLSFDRLNARNFFDDASGDTTTALTGRQFAGTSVPVFLNNQQVNVTNDAGEKDKFALFQGGFAFGGPIVRDKAFFFLSGELEKLDGTQERNFAVPTIEQRGIFGLGAQGVLGIAPNNERIPLFPTALDSEAVFSLFPFPNNPDGIFGRNTYTKALSTDARGVILSGKADWKVFKINGNEQILTARYNYTDDVRDLTDVGGALFSALRPSVRTDNFSTYLAGGVTDNVSNEFRFSIGRTRLRFEEIRDDFLRPVNISRFNNPNDAMFLLNAPFIINNTIASCPASDPAPCPASQIILPGTVDYFSSGTTTENTRLGLIGQLIVAGFSPVGVDVFNFPQERRNNTFQFADTLRWQINQHSLAFGTDIRPTFLGSNLPRNSRPLVTFNGIRCDPLPGTVCAGQGGFIKPTDLVSAGAATGFFQSVALPGKDANIDLSYYQLNFFIQDDWRAASNLRFSFGLRYELNTTPKEADGKIEDTFDDPLPSYLSGLSRFIDGRTGIYESDKNNFAPRIGFAYSPTRDTVIRGGFGIYYDQILGAVVSQSRNVFPTFSTINFGGGVLIDNQRFGANVFTFFNPLNAIIDPVTGFVCNRQDRAPACVLSRSIPLIQPGTLNSFNSALTPQQIQQALQDIFANFPFNSGVPFGATLPTRELNTPFSYQYSIGFEQRLFKDNFISVAYVGTQGRDLLRFTTPNLGNNYIVSLDGFFYDDTTCPNNISTCEPYAVGTTDSPAGQATDVGPINQFETTGRSRYDSLQIELRGRLLKQKFQYQVNYVYGRVKDDVSDVFDLAGAFALPQNSRTFEGEYAFANFDVRHRFTYNFIYDLPRLRGQNSVVRFLFGDWQVAGAGRFNTGQPFTVNSIYDVNQDGNLTDRLDNTQFITQTGDNRQPLQLSCAGTQCQQMLAPFGEDGDVPRNSFRAGDILELDLSFSKRFTIRENHNLQFRMDVFNFTNRANFGVPVRFLEFPSFGQATDTVTPGRRIQFALKYNF